MFGASLRSLQRKDLNSLPGYLLPFFCVVWNIPMAASSILKISLTISPLCFFCFFACICNGHYSKFYRKSYAQGEELYVLANSITSISTQLPFNYYCLPYCIPHGGIRKRAENLGELLMGIQIVNSHYRFRMNINESLYLYTSNPLTEEDVEHLKQITNDLYQVNMILDKLPVARFVKIQWNKYSMDRVSCGLQFRRKFSILYHKSSEIQGTNSQVSQESPSDNWYRRRGHGCN